MPRTTFAFISGHLDPPPIYFSNYYVPRISAAIQLGHGFVLGPSRGIDTMALEHLLSYGVPPSHITVFLSSNESSEKSRYVGRGVNATIAGNGHTERDEACTRASHYDILRYLTAEEAKAHYGPSYKPRVSGTQKNEIRRGTGVGLKVVGEVVADGQEVPVVEVNEMAKKRRAPTAEEDTGGEGDKLESNQIEKVNKLGQLEKGLEELGE